MAGRSVRRSSSYMLVFTTLVVAGCGPTASPDRTREAPRVTVAHPVVRSLVDEDDYNGWLEAFKTVEVRARVRGHITKVHFNDGDIVKEGQPLFDLDAAPFEAELRQVEAQIRALEAQKLAADKEVERNRNLLKSSAVSQQEFRKVGGDRRVIRRANRGQEGRSGQGPARPEVREDHRRPGRQDQQGQPHRRQPRQRRRERSALDDDRGHRPDLRGF